MAKGTTRPSTDSTTRKKAAFLEHLRDGHSVTAAAKHIKIDRTTAYNWRNADEEFAEAWADAWESGGDWYEDQNREQANQGNMAAVLNGLRMHKRIVERQHTTIANDEEHPVGVLMLPPVQGSEGQ